MARRGDGPPHGRRPSGGRQHYYNQDPRLLRFVLSKPPDRVRYDNLRLARKDFEEIADLALKAGILTRSIAFEEYADPRFSEHTVGAVEYPWPGPAREGK